MAGWLTACVVPEDYSQKTVGSHLAEGSNVNSYLRTVRKTGTFISIDKDGVNIQEIYCISLDLYIRIFPSPNLPLNFKNYLYL